MNPIRKCCGYYCAFVMFIGIFFYMIIILLELTQNQFIMNKLQPVDHGEHKSAYTGKDWSVFNQAQKDLIPSKMTAMAIAIAVILFLVTFMIA